MEENKVLLMEILEAMFEHPHRCAYVSTYDALNVRETTYAHLLPKDEEAFEHYNAFSAKRLDEANKIGKINLAATGKDLMDDEKQGDVTIDLFAAVDLETDAAAERSSELENNQTLGLLTGFLLVDDW
ncbi:unnamed protein product [Ilex paraguariensis]|uniref:Uncharacterized protein n=1 Tax=Ilex paraguariensis TaxID=185542 RepID=A0ABC8TFC1_9AQUA